MVGGVWNTTTGHSQVQKILRQSQPPIEPHSYQIEGICVSLDGEDILITMATGSGKTGFFSFTMMVMLAISKNPTLAVPGSPKYPEKPVMLIILPTKALQEDMRRSMEKVGLEAVVLNGDTCKAARKMNQNLWDECRTKYSMLLISPEELLSSDFRQLLDSKDFLKRICRFGVDEAHLIYDWGKTFRESFLQMGLIRARLPSMGQRLLPLIAVSATIRDGLVKDTICKVLGLEKGQYHFLRRSNRRSDIQIVLRALQSPSAGLSFPELNWVLDETESTAIFCKTISQGFRILVYLWRLAVSMELNDIAKRVRLFNSLNSAAFNAETFDFIDSPTGEHSIVVATDVLSVGWDSKRTRNVVIYGEPENIDEFVQKIGRVGRNRQLVKHPRAILYHSKGARAVAQAILDNQHTLSKSSSATRTKEKPTMELSMAKFLLANCYPAEIDQQYSNAPFDPPCDCRNCVADATESQVHCTCSGCQPETLAVPDVEETVTSGEGERRRAKPGEGISKRMRTHASNIFEQVRLQIYRSSHPPSFTPPFIYLPTILISRLTDSIYSINTCSDVTNIVQGEDQLKGFHGLLYSTCVQLHTDFEKIRAEEKQERLAKKKASDGDGQTTVVDDPVRSENDNVVVTEATGIRLRIDFAAKKISVVE